MYRTSLKSLARELSSDVCVDMGQTKSRGRGKLEKSDSRKKHRVIHTSMYHYSDKGIDLEIE